MSRQRRGFVRPGDLDRTVVFQRSTIVDDGFRQEPVWSTHGGPVRAKKTELSDGERWRAGEVSAGVTTRFVVRYNSFTIELTPKDRLLCEGREYDITGIKEVGARHRWLEITAAARADQ